MFWCKVTCGLLGFTILIQCCVCEINNDKGKEHNYFNHLKKQTRSNMKRFLTEKFEKKDVEINIKFSPVQYSQLSSDDINIVSLSIFGNNDIIAGNKTYSVVFKNSTFTLEPNSLQRLTIKPNMSFARVIKYNDFGLLYASYNNYSRIYIRNNSTSAPWIFIQSIASVGRVADAHFFINNKELRLIILSNQDHLPTYSKVYKWSGIHFDEIDKFLCRGATKVLSFQDQSEEIIIILEKNHFEAVHNVVIYKFKDNHLIKHQLILTDYSSYIVLYSFERKKYLGIFQEKDNSILYKWIGEEFSQVSRFSIYENIQQVFSVCLADMPIVFVVQKDKLSVLSHTWTNLNLIGSLTLSKRFRQVLDITITVNGLNFALFIFAQTQEKGVGYIAIPFRLPIIEIDKKTELNEVIVCMLNLEAIVKDYKQSVTIFPNKTVLHSSEAPSSNDTLLSSAAHSNLQNTTVSASSTIHHNGIADLKLRIEQLTLQLNSFREKLNSAFVNKDMNIYGKLIIKGKLRAQNLSIVNLQSKFINGVKWKPNDWLSYNQNQTIIKKVTLKELHVKRLTLQNSANILKDTFLRNGNQSISSKFVFGSIKANHIDVEKVNDIEFGKVYLRNNPSVIRGVKSFDSLNTADTKISYLNNGNATEQFVQLTNLGEKNYLFTKSVFVKNFNFEEINGVHWNSFKDSVFRVGSTNRITGNLSFLTMQCNKLFVKKLGDIDSNNLFTLSTRQNITSNMGWKTVLVGNVMLNQINNVNLSDMATINSKNIIKGPITINEMNIKNGFLHDNLELSEEEHIIGTKDSDLLLIHRQPVKIIGNLHVSNLSIFTHSEVIINSQHFTEEMLNNYWSKTKFQVIPALIQVQQGIGVPDLSTNVLNNIHVSSYLTNDLEDKLPINWVFENVTILGNVFINPSATHTPNLRKLDQLAVKTKGRYNITGQKVMQGRLRIKNLVTNYLDEAKVDDVWDLKTNPNTIEEKVFEILIVRENVFARTISVNSINNIQLEGLKNAVLYIDKDEDIDGLYAKNITASDIKISFINTEEMKSYQKYLNEMYASRVLEEVNINGNLKVVGLRNLLKINEYEVNILKENVFGIDSNQATFVQNVKIDGNVFAEHVEAVLINGINFSELIQRMFYRGWDQNITGYWTFGQLNTPNIFVPQINDVSVDSLIDIKSGLDQNMSVWGDLHFNYPIFKKSINSKKMACDIKNVITNMKNPSTMDWDTVHVTQNVTMYDNDCDLNILISGAVNSKTNNVIESQVTFEHHLSANTIYIRKLINGVYLNEILNDALLKDSTEQIITGSKRFLRLIVSEAAAEVANIPLVNDINIKQLNENVIHKDTVHDVVIKGPKVFFGGLQAFRLMASTISDINPRNLVSLNNPSVIPKAYFSSLTVDNNLNFEFVNNINMSHFMTQRLLRRSSIRQFAEGNYYFDDVLLLGESSMPSINGLYLNDIVFDADTQVIESKKEFTNTVWVNGNASIHLLNGEDFSELYKNSILLGQSSLIYGYIRFSNISISGNVQTERINGVTISEIQNYLESGTPVIEGDVIRGTIREVDNLIGISLNLTKEMEDHYLYLEVINEFPTSFTNVSQAYAFQSEGSVLLLVTQNEAGNLCGFKSMCNCPSQKMLQIANENSVNKFSEENIERVFSYEGDNKSVRLTTNTISTSETCRTNSFNESTSLMWMTFSPNGSTDHSYYPKNLTGYISGVQYFTHNNDMYVVITRYYDPIQNTHKVPCLVMKLTKEKGEVQIIQSIETHSAWVLHLFHTIQGVVIIIGSFSSTEKWNDGFGTAIYRFDGNSEQFKLLRKVSCERCISAVGVVSGPDSLFVLANSDAPLQVYKYHPKYDNYYFYQNIFTDSPAIGLSRFYTESDLYLCVVTKGSQFYIYTFKYVQGWEVLTNGEIEDLQALVPFHLNNNFYLFAISKESSLLLSVVKHGFN